MDSFLYLHCFDVAAAREFYSDVVGLGEIYFSAEEASVGYRVGSLQLTIGEHSDTPVVDGWSSQLGWQGGTSAHPSWGFHLDAEQFQAAVAQLRRSNVDVHRIDPEWVGYWSFRVKDPMGNTVELSATDEKGWPPA